MMLLSVFLYEDFTSRTRWLVLRKQGGMSYFFKFLTMPRILEENTRSYPKTRSIVKPFWKNVWKALAKSMLCDLIISILGIWLTEISQKIGKCSIYKGIHCFVVLWKQKPRINLNVCCRPVNKQECSLGRKFSNHFKYEVKPYEMLFL